MRRKALIVLGIVVVASAVAAASGVPKITICHIPPGNRPTGTKSRSVPRGSGTWRTATISGRAARCSAEVSRRSGSARTGPRREGALFSALGPTAQADDHRSTRGCRSRRVTGCRDA